MTDPAKSNSSFNLLKKRKKRKDLDKLILGRQYHHVRTSSYQDFHKMNSINDCTNALSSSDDTTTLLNSTDEGLEYYTNSLNRQKSKIFCCSYNHCIILNCLVSLIAIIGFIFLLIVLFVNKSNYDQWKVNQNRDISEMRLQIVNLQSQVFSSKTNYNSDYINQTISNHTLRLLLMEQKTNELSKVLIKSHFDSENKKKLSEILTIIRELYNNDSKMINLMKNYISKVLEIESLCYKLSNSSYVLIKNTTSPIPHIDTILFQPNIDQIKSFPNDTTAVLLSLSEYRKFLKIMYRAIHQLQ